MRIIAMNTRISSNEIAQTHIFTSYTCVSCSVLNEPICILTHNVSFAMS